MKNRPINTTELSMPAPAGEKKPQRRRAGSKTRDGKNPGTKAQASAKSADTKRAAKPSHKRSPKEEQQKKSRAQAASGAAQKRTSAPKTGRSKHKNAASGVKIIPLGGIGEVGKNMTVIEWEDNILVVDCGLVFPRQDMLGIYYVIPDITYLEKNKSKIKGFVLTHGHEDHIGATPYVLDKFNVPVYGTKLTLALVELKLSEHGVKQNNLRCVKAYRRF